MAEGSLLRARLADSPSVVLGTLGLLLICCLLTAAGSRRTAVLLVPLAAAWLLVNGHLEGPVLLSLSHGHGVTGSDLLSVLALVLAGRRLLSGTPAAARR